jgi:hypothetical protein
VAVHSHPLLLPVEVCKGRNVAADGAPGQPRILVRDVVRYLAALCLERPIGYVFDEEEKKLVLGNGISVAVLLPLAEGLYIDNDYVSI